MESLTTHITAVETAKFSFPPEVEGHQFVITPEPASESIE
jgi:hypothetical protein